MKKNKQMIYHIGDKFLVNNIESKVIFINNENAWVAPTEDIIIKGVKYYTFCAFEMLNEKGIDSNGKRAKVINNKECGAI